MKKSLAVYLSLIGLTLLFFWKILLTNLILAGVDVFLYFYPYKDFAAAALREGRLPLWNPHLFMGVPLLANSQVGLFYPLNWLLIWLAAPKQVAWSIGLHIALAGIFMAMLARHSLRLSRPAALVAACLFAFGGYLGGQVEHINQLNAIAWLPLLFLLYDLGCRAAPPFRPAEAGSDKRRAVRYRWFWFLLLALVIGLTLLAGHAQTVFISLFGLGLYALWIAVIEATGPPHRFRNIVVRLLSYLGPLAIVSILAAALAAIQLMPTGELSGLSIRSGGLTFRETVAFSVRPTDLHYVLLPPLGLDLSQLWGAAFSEWVAYVGIAGLGLALVGGLQGGREARRFGFVALSGLILSLGMFTGPLYLALYYLFPGFDLFRVPARWLLLYGFGVAVLAGIGFDALRHGLPRRRARWLLLLLLPLLALIAWKTPPLRTLAAWLALILLSGGLIQIRWGRWGLAALALIELFLAAQGLNYNQPTAPQAYHSLRNSAAYLLSVDPPGRDQPPGRFLSLSGITYDPGDLADLRRIYGDQLSEKSLYNLVVAAKQKEVLFFNIPLSYRLHSVDGYDGGLLPLARFISLQRLFLPPDDLSIDGRLREKLRFVPEGRLLSLLNTRWIITDKQFDAWVDNIFYDLQFPARLTEGQSQATTDIPRYPATAIGLVSHLAGAAALPDETVVAELSLTFVDGRSQTFPIRAGIDTAEGSYPPETAHARAAPGPPWPYQGEGTDYVTVYPLVRREQIRRIAVTARLPAGQFVLKGISLIHRPTTTSRSVLLTTEGDYRLVHSGDIKIYENLAVLPRAFIVHETELVSSEEAAIRAMRSDSFDPGHRLVRLAAGEEEPGLITRGRPGGEERAIIRRYEPERVEIEASLETPGWLVLTDTYYPGWQATVDGSPAEIQPVDMMFRGVALPAGTHTVLFEFRPRSVRLGGWLSGLSLAAVVIGLGWAVRRPKPSSES